MPSEINLTLIDQISCGTRHSLLLKGNSVYSFGNNVYGQLGLGDFITRTIPTKIIELNLTLNILNISAGGFHSMILTNKGVYTFGWNNVL